MRDDQLKALLKHLRDERKLANKTFGRSDPYGRGFKRGLDQSIRAAKAILEGKSYNPETDEFES